MWNARLTVPIILILFALFVPFQLFIHASYDRWGINFILFFGGFSVMDYVSQHRRYEQNGTNFTALVGRLRRHRGGGK